jgi:predicted GNAT family acetyltransferase
MDKVMIRIDDNGKGGFYITNNDEQLGEMIVSIDGKNLTVYHTEVAEKAEGKGLAKQMLNAMTEYARRNGLKVIPLCPYVHAQFKRRPDDYADIWNQ